MKILIKLNHPAHYHLFKNLKVLLHESNHTVYWVIKKRDILEKLLAVSGEKFKVLLTFKKNKKYKYITFFLYGIELVINYFSLLLFCLKRNPNILIGTDNIITYVGKTLSITSIVTNEDDYVLNKAFCDATYPYASRILTPNICDVGPFSYKKIGYDGYQKLAYLHPARFKPDSKLLENYLEPNKKYFLIRIVSFHAIHDFHLNASGFTESILDEVICILKGHGQIILSSEETISPKYEKYISKIPIELFHHALYHCSLFITDSQSMSVEAAMLGVPSIKFNSHVGTVSICEEIEKKYGLNIGVHSSQKEQLIETIQKTIESHDIKKVFRERRERMLREKIDVTQFFFWLLTNYPESFKMV